MNEISGVRISQYLRWLRNEYRKPNGKPLAEKSINEKLSKKEKRKIDKARRQTWGELNPVTRKPENSKAYNRNKARNWKREYHETSSGPLFYILSTGSHSST